MFKAEDGFHAASGYILVQVVPPSEDFKIPIPYPYNGLRKLDRNLLTLKFLSYEKIKKNI